MHRLIFLLTVIFIFCGQVLAIAEPSHGSTGSTSDPCCTVTAINAATGIVTAEDTETHNKFQFEVKDRKLLRTIKFGAELRADFDAKKVMINGEEFCCDIISQ